MQLIFSTPTFLRSSVHQGIVLHRLRLLSVCLVCAYMLEKCVVVVGLYKNLPSGISVSAYNVGCNFPVTVGARVPCVLVNG